MAASRAGNIRPSVQKKIDRMTVEIAVDLLLCRSNRAATIDRMHLYLQSWLGEDVRWEEENYADIEAQNRLGFAPQFHIITDAVDGSTRYSSAAYRHTRRYYYDSTDDDGNYKERETYL